MDSSVGRTDSSVRNEEPSDPLTHLSCLIFEGVLVDREDIVTAGIRDERHITCIESLAEMLQRGAREVRQILSLVFEKPADIRSFLKLLASEDGDRLERFNSLQVVRRLATGQITPPRLTPVVNASAKELVLAMVVSLLEVESGVIETAPVTWSEAVRALMSGLDRKEIIESFLDELGVDSSQKLPKWMHVWSQGNSDAVKTVKSFSGSDEFEIIEAALEMDGLGEMHAYELLDIDRLVQRVLSMEAPCTLSDRVDKLLRILARTLERAAEEFILDSHVSIIEIDLEDLSTLCVERRMQFDAKQCQIAFDVGEIVKSSYFSTRKISLKIAPPKWSLQTLPGLLGERPAQVVLSLDPLTGTPMWEVDALVSIDTDIVAHKRLEQHGMRVVFSVPSPKKNNPSQFVLSPGLRKIELHWEMPTLSELEMADIPSGLPVDVPLEISAPKLASLACDGIGCGTPKRRVLHISLHSALPKSQFQSDIVTVIDPRSEPVEKIIREVQLADSLLVDEEVLSLNPFVAGLLMGSGKEMNVLLADAGLERSELLVELQNSNLITLFSV